MRSIKAVQNQSEILRKFLLLKLCENGFISEFFIFLDPRKNNHGKGPKV